MEMLCIGMSHQTAPIELREKFAIPETEHGVQSQLVSQFEGIQEALIISTCNRVEFYLAVERVDLGRDAVQKFLGDRFSVSSLDGFFQHSGDVAVRHLFRVVSGLESMILGETEILGQVKKAYGAAQESGATGKHLNKLFQRAFRVAKEVRTDTNITRGAVSVGSVAAELAEKIFGRLVDCRVLILGAGETSELTAGALQARGVRSLVVANRSFDRASVLAKKMGGRAIGFEDWHSTLGEVDILIGSTAATEHLLKAADLAPILRRRPDRPLFCIDLGVPRDIDPEVNRLDGVYLYDIDSLQAMAEQSMRGRLEEVVICEGMIERHAVEFGEWLTATAVRDAGAFDAGEPERVKL